MSLVRPLSKVLLLLVVEVTVEVTVVESAAELVASAERRAAAAACNLQHTQRRDKKGGKVCVQQGVGSW